MGVVHHERCSVFAKWIHDSDVESSLTVIPAKAGITVRGNKLIGA
jgi:hypothetical protein